MSTSVNQEAPTETLEVEDAGAPRLSPAEHLIIAQQKQRLLARMFGAQPKLGRYVLREKIGEGGMGVVFAAFDPKLQRKVALKLLSVDHPDLRRRFVREARAMARLSHPNSVEIHEVGEFDDQAFIAMEYIDGPTLREWQSEKPRSFAEILEVYVAAGRGLAAAHERGLVHRDFKPSNVMIDARGRPRVMDFGVARAQAIELSDDQLALLGKSHESLLTHPGTLIGTPGYMSPEQACCEPTDARSDQFSFCVALYEALYGQRPFVSKPGEPPHFSELNQAGPLRGTRPAGLPRVIELALLRGLRLNPAERFTSMDELLATLAGETLPATPPRRRSRLLRALVWAATIALVALVLLMFYVKQRAHDRYAQDLVDKQGSFAEGKIEDWLSRVEDALSRVDEMAVEGELDLDFDDARINAALIPMLRDFHLERFQVVDSTGRGYSLSRSGDGWQSRRFEPGQAPKIRNWSMQGDFESNDVTPHAPEDLLWAVQDSAMHWSVSRQGSLSGKDFRLEAARPLSTPTLRAAVAIDPHDLSNIVTQLSVGRARVFIIDDRFHALALPGDQTQLMKPIVDSEDPSMRIAFETWLKLGHPEVAFPVDLEGSPQWAVFHRIKPTKWWIGLVTPDLKEQA